jgi:hypothetical protein
MIMYLRGGLGTAWLMNSGQDTGQGKRGRGRSPHRRGGDPVGERLLPTDGRRARLRRWGTAAAAARNQGELKRGRGKVGSSVKCRRRQQRCDFWCYTEGVFSMIRMRGSEPASRWTQHGGIQGTRPNPDPAWRRGSSVLNENAFRPAGADSQFDSGWSRRCWPSVHCRMHSARCHGGCSARWGGWRGEGRGSRRCGRRADWRGAVWTWLGVDWVHFDETFLPRGVICGTTKRRGEVGRTTKGGEKGEHVPSF